MNVFYAGDEFHKRNYNGQLINRQKESAKPATVIEKKVSVMLALLINKHYEEGLSIFKQEEIKLSSLGNKEATQLVVDAALDTKDYELLKKLYS